MTIKIDLSDDWTRRVWAASVRAGEEVASWPAWKRGEDVPDVRPILPPSAVPETPAAVPPKK